MRIRLVSPVFGKEMVTLARRKRHFMTRGLMIGLLLAVILVAWSDAAKILRHSGFADLASVGHMLFRYFAYTQILGVALLMPALAAPVVAAEKDRDTLPLLTMSNLSPINILTDKLLSRITLLSLLLLSGIPLFLALLAFGGVQPVDVAVAYAWMFGIMLFCAGLGLVFSTLLNKTHTAMTATFIFMAVYVLAIIILGEGGAIDAGIGNFFIPADLDAAAPAFTFLATSFMLFIVVIRACSRILPHVSGHRKRNVVKRTMIRLNKFFERINFTGIELIPEQTELGNNAALWKESSKHFFSSNTFLIRACYALIAATMLLLTFTGMWEIAGAIVCLGGLILLGMIATIASSAAFTSEREKRSFEVLMTSPLTGLSIVFAKFIGIIKLTVPVVVCMFLWLFVAGAVDEDVFQVWRWHSPNGPVVTVAFVTVAYVPMFIAIGLYASVKRKRIQSALLQAFVIIGAWCAAPLILPFLRIWNIARMSSRAQRLWLQFSPLSAGVMLVEGDLRTAWYLVLIPIWILVLVILGFRFDKLVGRQ